MTYSFYTLVYFSCQEGNTPQFFFIALIIHFWLFFINFDQPLTPPTSFLDFFFMRLHSHADPGTFGLIWQIVHERCLTLCNRMTNILEEISISLRVAKTAKKTSSTYVHNRHSMLGELFKKVVHTE